MKISKVKKLCAVALAATLGISILTGCGSKSTDKAATASKQEITYNLGADPRTLDPALNYRYYRNYCISKCFCRSM